MSGTQPGRVLVWRARHEPGPRTCVHCWEPVVRLQADGSVWVSVWVHTPARVGCVNALTGQPTGEKAAPREVAA